MEFFVGYFILVCFIFIFKYCYDAFYNETPSRISILKILIWPVSIFQKFCEYVGKK